MRAQTLPRSLLVWVPDAERTSKPIRSFINIATIARIVAVDADIRYRRQRPAQPYRGYADDRKYAERPRTATAKKPPSVLSLDVFDLRRRPRPSRLNAFPRELRTVGD